MGDVLLKCPACLKHLAVDEAAKGRTVRCVDCGRPVEVPQAVVPFACPACGWALSASASCGDESFHCPNCEEPVVLPRAAEPCRRRSVGVATQHGPNVSVARPSPAREKGAKACPECGSSLPAGAFVCAKCGYNTYTGKMTRPLVNAPVSSHVAPTEPALPVGGSNFPFWVGAIVAFGIFLGLKAYFGTGGGIPGFGARASITVEYAAPYTEDLAGVYDFGDWKKEVWGYSGVMRFHGWRTMGGHPHSIIIEFECRSSSGVVLGSGTASFPDLSAGERGRIELVGEGAAEAERIALRVGGGD